MFEKCTDVVKHHEKALGKVADVPDINEKNSKLDELVLEREAGDKILANLMKCSEKVLVNTAAAGRDAIRKDLKELRSRWEDVGDSTLDLQKNLESSKENRALYDDIFHQVFTIVTLVSYFCQ